jgi:hypothetical protein
MTWAIPAGIPYSLKKGNNGIHVWSLQKALTARGVAVGADGDFGPATEKAVTAWQKAKGLTADGVAGPVTQRSLVAATVDARDAQTPRPPAKLLYGFAEGEGGWFLAAVNWSVPGGVDCGAFQRRVYVEDYHDDAVIERAFNTSYQCDLVADALVDRFAAFLPRAGTKDGTGGLSANEKAWRLAALYHNYPSGADTLSKTPVKSLSAYWSSPQTWVTNVGYKFPDGRPVRTPLDWCELYAGVLGGYKGNITKYVTNWAP